MIKEPSHRSNVSTGSIQYTYYAFTFILTSSVCSFFIAIENALQTIDDLILMCSFNKRNFYIPCSCCNILTWYWNPDLVIQQLRAATYHTYNASASIGVLLCLYVVYVYFDSMTKPLPSLWEAIYGGLSPVLDPLAPYFKADPGESDIAEFLSLCSEACFLLKISIKGNIPAHL